MIEQLMQQLKGAIPAEMALDIQIEEANKVCQERHIRCWWRTSGLDYAQQIRTVFRNVIQTLKGKAELRQGSQDKTSYNLYLSNLPNSSNPIQAEQINVLQTTLASILKQDMAYLLNPTVKEEKLKYFQKLTRMIPGDIATNEKLSEQPGYIKCTICEVKYDFEQDNVTFQWMKLAHGTFFIRSFLIELSRLDDHCCRLDSTFVNAQLFITLTESLRWVLSNESQWGEILTRLHSKFQHAMQNSFEEVDRGLGSVPLLTDGRTKVRMAVEEVEEQLNPTQSQPATQPQPTTQKTQQPRVKTDEPSAKRDCIVQ